MARWKRVLRGMLGMGLTFSAGAGIAAAIVVGVLGIIFGFDREMLIIVVGSAIWAFLIGVGFSGVMALTAGGTSFEKLSLPRFAALGTGVGLLCFGVLAINAWDAWSTTTAIVNAVILATLGGGSATASLLLARRAQPALEAAENLPRVGEG